ncbi:hypothetical protein [Saccharothrix xinjiangensis]|uniref:Uncharacterized protein n=1 Tax=Saccharothrix xinjiangensis TaxID=204798 RepID=A0ABV9XZ03_9PSEU
MTTPRPTHSPTRDQIAGGEGIRWDADPVFEFADEVDALMTVELLGQELKAARRQVEATMAYLATAMRAARKVHEDGRPTSKKAIWDASGLAKQTAYDIFDG